MDSKETNILWVDILLYLSIVLFLTSLILPVSCCLAEGQRYYGFHALFLAWLYLFSIEQIFVFLAWFSNFLLFSGWSRLNSGSYKASGIFSTFGLILSSGGIINMYMLEKDVFNGAYVWLSSFGCVLFASTVAVLVKKYKIETNTR